MPNRFARLCAEFPDSQLRYSIEACGCSGLELFTAFISYLRHSREGSGNLVAAAGNELDPWDIKQGRLEHSLYDAADRIACGPSRLPPPELSGIVNNHPDTSAEVSTARIGSPSDDCEEAYR